MFNALLRNFETIGEKFLQSLHPGFPTGVENMGGSSKFDGGGGLKSIKGEHRGLKMLPKNTFEGVHLIVELPAISLQAC